MICGQTATNIDAKSRFGSSRPVSVSTARAKAQVAIHSAGPIVVAVFVVVHGSSMPGPGVKGRPQACVTCRRRKKGCDLQRPSCGQCRKACIPCGGYTHLPVKQAAAGSAASATATPEPVVSTTSSAYVSSTGLPAGTAYSSPAPVPTTWSAELPLPLAPDDFGMRSVTPGEYHLPPASSGDHYPTPPPSSMPMTLSLHQRTPLHLAPQAPFDDDLPQDSYSTQTSQAPALPHSTNHPPDVNTTTPLDRHQLKLRARLLHQHAHNTHPSHSGPLAHTATTDRLISSFWSAYLPNSRPFPNGVFHITFGSSLAAMHSHSQSNHGLRRGLLALGLTTVGKAHASHELLEQGFRMYSDALQQVAHGLRNARGYSEEQLVATRLFGLYEALFGTEMQSHAQSARSWMLHSSGEAAILTANPPEAYITGQAHRLFIAGRHHMALSSMMHRKKTFLSEEAWKTVPWTKHPKSSRDWLLDIIVDVPSVVEGIEAMRTWEDQSKKAAYRKLLLRATEDIIARLLKWKETHAVEIQPSTLTEPLPAKLAPGMLANSHIMTLYYSISIRIRNIHTSITPPDETTPDRLDAHECCRQLIRGIRIFAHPDAGLFRQHIAPFPMSTALQFINHKGLDEMAEERLALWDVLNSPECLPVLQFVLSMEPLQARSLKLPEGL